MSSMATGLAHIAHLMYFMAPAYVANMTPPLVRYWRGWNRPISERWLGSHKTVVGFGAGVLAAVVVTLVQSRIAWPGGPVADDHWIALGLRFGAGAMGGDAAKSFVKRRLGIAPGKSWIPWDQLDFVLGALISGRGAGGPVMGRRVDHPGSERRGACPGEPRGVPDRGCGM